MNSFVSPLLAGIGTQIFFSAIGPNSPCFSESGI
jgi:hypothetical protein